ncbi:hypothetical protein SAY87_015449 [Trapa incisa]|uniref:Uncharacterized protein n=1 Tax=Trapa incisa TaxID=236973 RepID=A0AAN7GXA1_9MYRT|nr:hypothetical protein SAY87_015449 [Trapa incisa]
MSKNIGSLWRKVKKIDDEMEFHDRLLKEIEDNPTDVIAVVARCRKDFTGKFFRYLTTLSKTYDILEDCDGLTRLGAMQTVLMNKM